MSRHNDDAYLPFEEPQGLDELRDNADWFSKEFSAAIYEKGQAQNFIREWARVFGLNPLRVVLFEECIRNKKYQATEFIDGLFRGLMLVELKSAGENLDKAYSQAIDYLPSIPVDEKPLSLFSRHCLQ